MSRVSNLLRQVETQDPQLAADLKQEVEALSGRRAFGLNFERHIPETVELPDRPVRRGDKVRFLPERGEKPSSVDRRLWRVGQIRRTDEGRVADLILPQAPEAGQETASRAVDDLVVVAEFRDPIYGGLVSTGKVERGGDRPFHTVINAENFHALQVLLYTHEGKVDAIYVDPPLQHRHAGLEVQQRLRRQRRRLPPLQVACDDGAAAEAGKATTQSGKFHLDRDYRRERSSSACSASRGNLPGEQDPDGYDPHQSGGSIDHRSIRPC